MSVISGGGTSRSKQIAAELQRCRQRGLENLDRGQQQPRGDQEQPGKRRQRPVLAPELERLADLHARRQGINTSGGRIPKIKILLSAALEEYSADENEEDARLIHSLFFSDSTLTVRKSAGKLLTDARDSYGEPSETLFRERFKKAFGNFAEFLVQRVDSGVGGADAPSETDRPGILGSPLQVTAVLVENKPDRFIELLADSTEATVVGFDNELLVEALRTALELKRHRLNDPSAFWHSLEIVFLAEPLLAYMDDHAVSPDPRVALRERRWAQTKTRREVQLLLRRTGRDGWRVYDSPFIPAVTGSLFVLPGSQHRVQLIARQPAPRKRIADHVYLEGDDLPNEYFTKAFRRVVDRSTTENRPVPVGIPFGKTFVCTETVYRDEVLKPDSGRQDWLPMVLIVTTQRRRGQIAPVLQARTEVNAVREINTVSHLSRHIYQDETPPLPGAKTISAPSSIDAKSECALRAAQLRVQLATGDDTPLDIREMPTGKYVNPNTDNLFFFVYSVELPEEMKLESEMLHFSLGELVNIRAHHALRIAAEMCKVTDRPAKFWSTAVELATLNLALHNFGELGERLTRLAGRPPRALADLSADIASLIRSTQPTGGSSSQMKIVGLSGWQYREFYTVLVPRYEEAGVPGASEELRRISKISMGSVKSVFPRVDSLYKDEDLLRSIPIEL
jgi:hypothetical protein